MADFDLTQSGQEIQNILDGAAMQTDLTAEIERAEQSEQQLQGNIDLEETRAKAAEKQNADDIDAINGKIPAAASSENKLADKAFVNSSIATATATYRGAYNLVSDLHLAIDATEEQIAAALAGVISTADNNDYCFVQVPTADATPTQIAAIERYKFNGTAWAYEYTLNNSGFTADQWAALNSGITTGLVAKLAELPTNEDLVAALAGKQPMLTFDNVPTSGSNNPVKSGGVYAAIAEEAGTRAAAIAAIVALIPSAASALNQLADIAFVNSSISTATAVFKGTFNVVADLELNYNASQAQIALMLGSKIASADNNDYCFVQIPTSNETPLEIARTDRYKYNGTAWAYEYTLNNSGFTAAQWAAINSGITSLLKDKLIDLPTATELATQLAAKQNALTFDDAPTSGSNNPVKSGGIKTAIDSEAATRAAAIAAIDALIPGAASTLNQLADKNFVNSSIATATATYRGSFNLVSDLEMTVDATHEQIAAALAGTISTADNNDYCFVQVPTADATPTQIAAIERYKFNGTAWAYEYTLNNSGFTADQWAALNSGITSGLVAKLAALPTNDDLVAALAGKQPMLTFDNVPTENSTNPVKSGGVYAAIDTEKTRAQGQEQTLQGNINTESARAQAAEQGLQDDYDNLYALYQTLEGGSIIPVAAADWPVSNPQQNVIYRVANSATPTAYSDYMYNGTTTLLLATFTFPGIDSKPTPDSTNLVTSGGVAKVTDDLSYTLYGLNKDYNSQDYTNNIVIITTPTAALKSGTVFTFTVKEASSITNIGVYVDNVLKLYVRDQDPYKTGNVTLTSDANKIEIKSVGGASQTFKMNVYTNNGLCGDVKENRKSIQTIENRIETKVTILGDSISTYQNYSTGGGYYPGGDTHANDVTSVDYTYWKIICDNLGYVCPFSTGDVTNPDITNLSIAGSSVSSYSNPVWTRTQTVKNSSLLIFAMGTNDYTHVEIGEFDYNTPPEEMSDSTFANAYIKNVKYLVNKYPDMDILCLSFGMGNDFANAIQTIAEHYGLMYLDLRPLLPDWEQHVHPNREEMHKVAVACMKHIGLYSKNISNKIASMSHYISLLEDKINELL